MTRGDFQKMIHSSIEAKVRAKGDSQNSDSIPKQLSSLGRQPPQKRKSALRQSDAEPSYGHHGEAQAEGPHYFPAKSYPSIMAEMPQQGNNESLLSHNLLRTCFSTKGGSSKSQSPQSGPKGAPQANFISSVLDFAGYGMPPYQSPKRDSG